MRIFPKFRMHLGLLLLIVSDIIIITGIVYFSIFVRKNILSEIFPFLRPFNGHITTYLWILPIWFFVLIYEGAYSRRFTFWDEIKFLWKSIFIVSLTIFTILFIGKQGARFSRGVILGMTVLSIFLLPTLRILSKRFIYSLGLMRRKVLIVGAGETGVIALQALKREKNLGYEVAGFIDDDRAPGNILGYRIHRGENKVERFIRKCCIHDIVIAKPEIKKERLIELMNKIQHKTGSILYIPDLSGIAVLGTELRHFFDEQTMVIEIKNNLDRPVNYVTKRIFDYLVSIVLLPFLLFAILIISILIRISSKGPAIYKQERIGKNGTPFICYKFRTMYVDADSRLQELLDNDPDARIEWEKYWKLKNDPRVTKMGKFLRKTSLDELPQIFNVLKGEMSLVGPRPYLPREWSFLKEYGEIILSVPPGITGLWQTCGRNDKTFHERLMLDSWYVRNWNLWLDIVILLKTMVVVIKREGAC